MEKGLVANEIREKSLTGISLLLKRQLFVAGTIFIGNIVLARMLAPSVFGIYSIVSFVVQFFSIFSDVGIGASLIQKKESLTEEMVSTVFWLQQMLTFTMSTVVFLGAPLTLRIYPSLPPVSVWLIRCMAVTLIFSSLKTIPAILMERRLDFRRIAIIEIIENVVFQIVAIALAAAGFDIWSFVVAALARGLAGLVLINLLAPWRPLPQFQLRAVRELLSYGFSYQTSSVLSFIKEAVTPFFIGIYSGASSVGYLNWARDVAFAPMAFSQSFGRVAFPAFSQLQDQRNVLKDAIERSIRMITTLLFPMTVVLMALAPVLIPVVFSEKWMPAINAFYFYCTSPLLIGIMLPLYTGIVSLGRADVLIKMGLLLLFLEWGLGVPFVVFFGFAGIAFNQPIITGVFLLIYKRILAIEGVSISLTKNVFHQALSAGITGLTLRISVLFMPHTLLALVAACCCGFLLFLILLFLMNKTIILECRTYALEILKTV